MTASAPEPVIDLTRWIYTFVHIRSYTCRSGGLRGQSVPYGVIRRVPVGMRASGSLPADVARWRVTVRGLGPARSECVSRAQALAQSAFDYGLGLEVADVCADLPAAAYRTAEATLRALEARIIDQPVTREIIPYR